jgi:hypothetical protein
MHQVIGVLASLGALVIAAQVGDSPNDLTGYAIFGTIVGVILGGFRTVEWIVNRRNGRSANSELRHVAECLERVESALNAQTTAMALIAERQKSAHKRMDGAVDKITDRLKDIERKVA